MLLHFDRLWRRTFHDSAMTCYLLVGGSLKMITILMNKVPYNLLCILWKYFIILPHDTGLSQRYSICKMHTRGCCFYWDTPSPWSNNTIFEVWFLNFGVLTCSVRRCYICVVWMANSSDQDQTAPEISLIGVYTVSSDKSVRILRIVMVSFSYNTSLITAS